MIAKKHPKNKERLEVLRSFNILDSGNEKSICRHAIFKHDFLEIKDTRLDERTVNNPLCQGEKPVLFYAGAVLQSFDNWPLGTLCVLDYKPRILTPLQRRVLRVHANNVMQQLELTRALINEAKHITTGPKEVQTNQEQTLFNNEVRSRFETLTPREKDVVGLMAQHSGSLSSKELARELGISPRTVDHHRASIMSKMDVDSVAELIIVGLKSGILS